MKRIFSTFSSILCLALTLGYASAQESSPSTDLLEFTPSPSLELTPAMREFLEIQRVTRTSDPILKMQRILDGLFASEEQPFGYAATDTLTASQAFEARRGNCVSFALLFVALARDVGLDARFNQINYAPVWEEVDGILVETSHINAIVFTRGKQYIIESRPDYREVASRSRNPISDARVFSHYYNNKGLIALTKQQWQASKDFIDKAIAVDPTNGVAWQNLGLLKFREGDQTAGEQALLRASQLNRQSSSVCFLLAQFYEKTGDSTKSAAFEKLGAKRSKKNPFYHYHKSQDALANGDSKRSAKHLEQALKLLPEYSKFKHELANRYRDLDQSLSPEQSLAKAESFVSQFSG